MKEYIEKAAALEALSKSGVTCNMRAHKIVASIQAADVVEVRHGRWSSNGIALVCSECGRAFGIVKMFAHYFPWCGSRMDKEADHEVSE